MGMPLDEWIAKGKQEQKEADAALVEAGRCVCYYLFLLDDGSHMELNTNLSTLAAQIFIDFRTSPPTVTKHASCYCQTLAEQIRRQP